MNSQVEQLACLLIFVYLCDFHWERSVKDSNYNLTKDDPNTLLSL